jgi:hypothetical protein
MELVDRSSVVAGETVLADVASRRLSDLYRVTRSVVSLLLQVLLIE